MGHGVRIMAVAVAAFGLSGCADFIDIDEVAAIEPRGDAYQSALHREYVSLARDEVSENDVRDVRAFLSRAEMSANGVRVDPEPVSMRDVPEVRIDEFRNARAAVMLQLSKFVYLERPDDVARLQALFDCWIENAEETWSYPDRVDDCRDSFQALLAELDPIARADPDTLRPMPVASLTTPLTAALEPEKTEFTVYFASESARIGTEATAILGAAVGEMTRARELVVRGFTDTAGSLAYNRNLAERRVRNVVDFLTDAGVDPARIRTEALGETTLEVVTADGVAEPRNRRVVIEAIR